MALAGQKTGSLLCVVESGSADVSKALLRLVKYASERPRRDGSVRRTDAATAAK